MGMGNHPLKPNEINPDRFDVQVPIRPASSSTPARVGGRDNHSFRDRTDRYVPQWAECLAQFRLRSPVLLLLFDSLLAHPSRLFPVIDRPDLDRPGHLGPSDRDEGPTDRLRDAGQKALCLSQVLLSATR